MTVHKQLETLLEESRRREQRAYMKGVTDICFWLLGFTLTLLVVWSLAY